MTVEVDRGDPDATAGVERKFYASPEALYMREYEWVQPVRWVGAYGWRRPLSCLDAPSLPTHAASPGHPKALERKQAGRTVHQLFYPPDSFSD